MSPTSSSARPCGGLVRTSAITFCEVISPGRAAAQDRRHIQDALPSGALMAYEVAGWEGRRSIGGWSGARLPNSLTLTHGEVVDDAASWIEVTTHCGEEADFATAWVVEGLERRLAEVEVPLPDHPSLEDFRQRQRQLHAVDPPDWDPTSIVIGSGPAPGHIAQIRKHWVAYLKTEGVLVSIVAYAVDPASLRLTALASLSAYE